MMVQFPHLDLLTVGFAVAALLLIGVAVLFANPRDRIGRYFALFCFINALWGITNYTSYHFQNPVLVLVSLRFILFLAVFQSVSFYTLILSFGNSNLPKWFLYLGLPFAVAVAIPALTPAYFSGVTVGGDNLAPQPEVAPTIGLFAATAIFFVFAGLRSLFRQLKYSTKQQKEQLEDILIGTALMFILIISLNFIAPVLFNTTYFVPLGAVFVLPFAILAAYAILRFQLFNVKAVATGVLTFVLVIIIFAEVAFADSAFLQIWKIIEASLVLVFGIVLFRSVVKEVEQREKIQKLAEALEETNERQEGLIRFISHEVKNFLAKDRGAFASLVENDFGKLPDELRPFVQRALNQATDAVTSVMDILKASNQKKGTIEYKKEDFDLKALTILVIEKMKPLAETKGLKLSFVSQNESFQMNGDQNEIGDHVLRNLIENSINYTPTGEVSVSLTKKNGKYVFAVRDTGVGITEEDKKHLFTEGGHGKDSQRINVHSTGYGLFIAKNITEAHGGSVSAESRGPGQGSTFTIEFPF